MTSSEKPLFSYQHHMQQPETHQVLNQPQSLFPFNTFSSDQVLQYWTQVYTGHYHDPALLSAYGALCGNELTDAGFAANQHKPVFHSHDRFGNRIDEVHYHPAYHRLMNNAVHHSLHCLPWQQPSTEALHTKRAALIYQHVQADPGTCCPLTMTFASVPAIRGTPEVAALWLDKITTTSYDPANKPWYDKNGLTIGMAMTEKQGGSDVKANTTRAYPLGSRRPGQPYKLIGHKWFCSAPMSDAFLVLAQTENGLSCFLLPRWQDDGSKNALYIQRLKDKLGNCSNASSEIEFRGATGWLLGEEGRGVRTIIDMVAMTRFDCVLGSAGLMRAAVAQALHHTAGRNAFGRPLHQQPLMQNVLADLAVEQEAALALGLRLAYALDHPRSEQQQLFARIATAIGKYWVCKRAPQMIYEAMECIGGVGYVEDNILPRLYREAPVNAIWEGSGNIQCLDILRAIQREPATLEALFAETECHAELAPYLSEIKQLLGKPEQAEFQARLLADRLAVLLQGAILLQQGMPAVTEAFIHSRLEQRGTTNYGTLPAGSACETIIQRALPAIKS
ncbi:acyl-CoA dehydrogenase family protein [Chromatiaceae bacterium AAb-1]|nr:acyl-CoA dehydrogenase family protein [Chromatiaceae bacterium AAb-1]